MSTKFEYIFYRCIFMMSRTVFLFVQIIFLQCKITEAVKQSGKIIQGHGLQESLLKILTVTVRAGSRLQKFSQLLITAEMSTIAQK